MITVKAPNLSEQYVLPDGRLTVEGAKLFQDFARAINSVKSTGNSGGAGSAGAGNQYVELVIDGTTYKLLHD